MPHSTQTAAAAATAAFQEFVAELTPELLALFAERQAFRQAPPTPQRTDAFERAAAALLREVGRRFVEREYNRLEPEHLHDCPRRLRLAGQEYRRRPKSRQRLGTLFGEITLWRYLYEATEAGERALFPLELRLGVAAGLATPALAERVGRWAAEHEQEAVRTLLRQEHGVAWSVQSLRRVTAALRDGLAPFRAAAQVARLLELLARAFAAPGRQRPVLVAGRDGIHVPLRHEG
jgi:hypothetical protein